MRAARLTAAILYAITGIAVVGMAAGIAVAAVMLASDQPPSARMFHLVLDADEPFAQDDRPFPTDPASASLTLAGEIVDTALLHTGLTEVGLPPWTELAFLVAFPGLVLGVSLPLARTFSRIAQGDGLAFAVAAVLTRTGMAIAGGAVLYAVVHTTVASRAASQLAIEGFTVRTGPFVPWSFLLAGLALAGLGALVREGANVATEHELTV